MEQQAAAAGGRGQRDGADHGDDDRRRGEAEGMSDSPDLTPEDVKEILRLVDESQFDEFELETPRLTIRFRRGEAPPPPGAPEPPARPAESPQGLVDVTAPMVGTFYRAPGPGEAPFVEVGSARRGADAGLHPRGDEADERGRRRRPRRRRGGLRRERRAGPVRRRALPHPPGMIGLVDTTVRDGHQSLWSADALTTAMIAEIAPVTDRVGFRAIDFTSSTHMADGRARARRGPVGAHPRRARADARDAARLHHAGHAVHGVGARTDRRDAARAALRHPQRHPAHLGRRVDERRRDRPADRAHREGGGRRRGARRPRLQHQPGAHRRRTTPRARGRSRASADVDVLNLKDPGGLLTPERVRTLVPALREAAPSLPLEVHSHCTATMAPLVYLESARLGASFVCTAVRPLANGTSQPSAEQTIANLRAEGFARRARRGRAGGDVRVLHRARRAHRPPRRRAGRVRRLDLPPPASRAA